MNQDVHGTFWHRGYLLTLLATAEETSGGFSLIESVGCKGQSEETPLHVHTCETEYFYLIQGAVILDVGGDVIRPAEHRFVALPRNVPHCLEIGSACARFLHLYIPGGYEGFLRELSEPARALTPPPAALHRDIGRLITVAAKYGVQIISPPSRPATATGGMR